MKKNFLTVKKKFRKQLNVFTYVKRKQLIITFLNLTIKNNFFYSYKINECEGKLEKKKMYTEIT